MTKSKITAILGVRQWEGHYGPMWAYSLRLEDGTIAEINKKKPDAYHVGQELTYELEDAINKATGATYKKLKEVREQGDFGGRKLPPNNRAFALSYAKDVEVAIIGKEGMDAYDLIETVGSYDNRIIDRAQRFLDWLENKSSSGPQDVIFDGSDMRVATDGEIVPAQRITYGAPPEIETTRQASVAETYPTPTPAQKTPQNGSERPEKPHMGGVVGNGKPVSVKQMALLVKKAEQAGDSLSSVVASEWDDISDPKELSSWAASYLIDHYIHLEGA